MKQGTLYAIGVGPGSPDLLTIRAVKALSTMHVILAASSSTREYSRALTIAQPYLPPNVEIITLNFPMTRDESILNDAWHQAAMQTLDILQEGKNAAFLTLGDPMIYSTFTYLKKILYQLDPSLNVQSIPGITSFQAAANQTGLSLCMGDQPFSLISGITRQSELVSLLSNEHPAAILKVYRNYRNIENALLQTNRLTKAIAVSELGLPDESIQKLPLQKKPGYMTLILSPAPGK